MLLVSFILNMPTLATDRERQEPKPPPLPKATESPGGFTTYPQPGRPAWLPEQTVEDLLPETSFPDSLTRHPLFLAEYPVADCPDPHPFKDQEEYRRYSADLAECILTAWTPHFTTLGRPLNPVQVVSFETHISTPCGDHDARFSAMYCPANETIYLGRESFEEDLHDPTYAAMTTIHEVFHHIQYNSGILELAYTLPIDELEISRRVELQTICSESRQSLTLDIGFSGRDYRRLMSALKQVGEEVHGSNESLTYWGGRGFHVTTLQGCNTWLVPSDMVD